MTYEEKKKLLKTIFWDYDTSSLPLDKIINKEYNSVDEYEFRMVFNRMLERLNWYDLLDLMGVDLLKVHLTNDAISGLRSKELKDKYERIRRILFEEPLSLSGWDAEYIKRIRYTLLSNRWYAA